MDYGKYLYQQEKKEREAKKHQKTITVKEVKFRINVDDHDYETKKNHVLRFLDEGDKVKATIFFRGREMTRTGLGRQILERLIKDVEPHSIVEFRPRQEGNTLHAILAPKKTEKEREKERQKEEKHKAAAQKCAQPERSSGAGRQARVVGESRFLGTFSPLRGCERLGMTSWGCKYKSRLSGHLTSCENELKLTADG